jgi:hypothetical protein
LSIRAKGATWAAFALTCSVFFIVSCDSQHLGRADIDGYWKGQIVKVGSDDNEAALTSREAERPRRILMRLEETSGVVQGKFAQSSDVVAFARLDERGSRSVAVYPVEGTLDGTEVLMQFASDDGLDFDVKATIAAGKMSGTYTAETGAESRVKPVIESGTFEIERY